MSDARSKAEVKRSSALKYFLIVSLVLAFLITIDQALAQPKDYLMVKASGAELFTEESVEKIKDVQGIAKLEKYLLVRTEPHDVIGVEAGAPGRVIVGDKVITARLEVGRWFREEDKNAAVVGKVYREDYTKEMSGMSGMKHFFEIGSTFELKGYDRRIRVVGGFSADPESAADKIFLPIATVQRIYQKEGQLSHILITLKSAEFAENVTKAIKAALGPKAERIPY